MGYGRPQMRWAGTVGVLFVAWTGVAHAAPVKVYVSAGGPVANAVVTVDGARALHTTDLHGYVVVDVRSNAAVVHITARGGHVGKTPVRGSLRATIPHPFQRADEDLYVDPFSTIVDAYLTVHPGTSDQIAKERVRALLAIHEREDTERALRHRPRYFDGLRWLRYANLHGGVDAFARRLARRIDQRHGPVTFVAELDTSVDPLVSALRTAGSAMGIISGTFTIVNDILNWTQAKEPTNGQIYSTVQNIQTELGGIKTELDSIKSSLDSDFTTTNTKLDQGACATAFRTVEKLAGEVDSANTDYEDLLTNATSKSFSATLASNDLSELQADMKSIDDNFNDAADTFHDALLPNAVAPLTPMLDLCATYLQDVNNQFLTPAMSASLDRLSAYVVYYQAMAFNLIVSYWSRGTTGTPIDQITKISDALDIYLGISDASDWATWLGSLGGELYLAPATSDYGAEASLIYGIEDVPAGKVIDPSGRMWSDTAAPPIDMSTYLPDYTPCDFWADESIGVGDDTDNSPFADQSLPVCHNLWGAFQRAQSDALAATTSMDRATTTYNWTLAGTGDLQTLSGYTGSTTFIHGPAGAAWNTLDYWDAQTWCPDAGVESQDCTATGDYNFDQLTFDAAGNACENPKSACYPASGFCDIPCYAIADRIQFPITQGGTSLRTGAMISDGQTKQEHTLLYGLLYRDPLDYEHYWPS